MGSRGRISKPKRKRERLSSAPRPAHRPRSKQSGIFAKYMDASPLTTAEIAEKLNVSPGYLINLRVGNRTPGRALAVEIEKLTDGMVPVASWS